jgi:hypothetical protein
VEDVTFILGMEEYLKEEQGAVDFKREQDEEDLERIRERERAWREVEMENDAFFVR